MKKSLLLLTLLFLFASAGAAQKTSFEYLIEGSKHYLKGDYKNAIPQYQKALDLEKKERNLEKKFWIVLVDNLGMAYGITGDIKSSFSVFEYGISVEPTYPLFYYNMACGHGELGEEDNAIKWLRLAYKHKANMMPGERFPNPETDSSFAKFMDSEKFRAAVKEMKSGKQGTRRILN
jgi:tetratricopeptide (TPR) repeat protein